MSVDMKKFVSELVAQDESADISVVSCAYYEIKLESGFYGGNRDLRLGLGIGFKIKVLDNTVDIFLFSC